MAAAAVPVDPLPPPPEGVSLDASRLAIVTTLAGSEEGFADGIGAAAQFSFPHGIAVAPSGIVYVADTVNHRIRQIDPATGAVSTLAGSLQGFADGIGVAAQFSLPHGIAVAPSGVVYVADTHNHRIRQIDPATGAVSTLAGSVVAGFADGVGAAAQFLWPQVLAIAPSGIVYVSDKFKDRISQIDPATGAVTTLAGSVEGFADGLGAAVRLNRSKGLAIAPSGVVYVADTNAHRIRQIDPVTGAITTLAGSVEGFADGVGAAARFNYPQDLVVAPSGVVYVTDGGNNKIRQIDPVTGAVTTLAGSEEGFADGVGAAARFENPVGIDVAPSGVVYVSDMLNNRIRQITFRPNPGFVHMARKAIVNSKSKLGVLPENVVGDIFSYVGNTRGGGGGLHPRRAAAEEGAGAVAAMNELNRRNTRRRKTRTNRRKSSRKSSRKTLSRR